MIICPAWDFTSIRLSWNLFCLQHPPMTSIDPLQSQTFSPYPYTPRFQNQSVSTTNRDVSDSGHVDNTPCRSNTEIFFIVSRGSNDWQRDRSTVRLIRQYTPIRRKGKFIPPVVPVGTVLPPPHPASTVPLHSGVMSSSVSCAEHKAS